MRIKIAKTAGFCFGVDRAVKMAFDTAKKSPRVVTLGPIIHNPQIVSQLEKMGVRAVESPEEIPADTNGCYPLSWHWQRGYDYLCAHGIPYVDATCPFVAKIHQIVKNTVSRDVLFWLPAMKRTQRLKVS